MEAILTYALYSGVSLSSTVLFGKACRGEKCNKIALCIAIIIPSVLSGFRGASVGSDTGMYIHEYYDPGTFLFGSGFTRTFEPGWRVLRNVIYKAGMPHQVLFIVVQALTLVFLFLSARSELDEIDVSVTMFVYMFDAYFQSFNMMRQALAVAIVIYSYTKIANNKNIKGICGIVLAGFIHQTAWVFLVVILAKYILKSRHAKIYILIGIIVAVFILANNDVLQRIAYFFLGEKAIWYTTTSDTGSRLWVYLLKISPIVILMALCIKEYFGKNKKVVFYAGLAMCGYILASYGNFVATDAQRMALYFSRLDAIVLGYAVMRKLYFWGRTYLSPNIIRRLIYAYAIVMFSYNYFYIGVSSIVPYSVD